MKLNYNCEQLITNPKYLLISYKYINKILSHTIQSYNNNKSYPNKKRNIQFIYNVFMGKFNEIYQIILYSDNNININKNINFDCNGYDGGVDFIINNKTFSSKLRRFNCNKNYYDNLLSTRELCFETNNILKNLIETNICDILLVTIRYTTNEIVYNNILNILSKIVHQQKYDKNILSQLIQNLDIFFKEHLLIKFEKQI